MNAPVAVPAIFNVAIACAEKSTRVTQEQQMKPTPVSAAEAWEMFNRGAGTVFVDARNPVAWGSSNVKLPGAIRIPAGDVDAHLGEVAREGAAIVYCT